MATFGGPVATSSDIAIKNIKKNGNTVVRDKITYKPVNSKKLYIDVESDNNNAWYLVSSNNASDNTIPGGTGRNNANFFLTRNSTLGEADPNKDYIIGSEISSLKFDTVRIFGWGRGSINGTYSFPSNLGSTIIAIWSLSQDNGDSRFTEVVSSNNVTFGGNTIADSRVEYMILDSVRKDVGLNANSNQSTIGAAGVLSSNGDPSGGTFLGHGSTEGSYEGWYVSGQSGLDSQGYTTWVKLK